MIGNKNRNTERYAVWFLSGYCCPNLSHCYSHCYKVDKKQGQRERNNTNNNTSVVLDKILEDTYKTANKYRRKIGVYISSKRYCRLLVSFLHQTAAREKGKTMKTSINSCVVHYVTRAGTILIGFWYSRRFSYESEAFVQYCTQEYSVEYL